MSSNGNVMYLWDNSKFDAATLTVDPAGAEDSDWPVENLQDTQRQKVFKSDGTGSLTIKIDLGSGNAAFCNALALVTHNLNYDATFTVRAYTDAWVTEALEEEFDAYIPLLLFGEGYFGGSCFGGYPDDDDMDLYPRIVRVATWEDTSELAYRYWSIEIDNDTDEFYLGRVFLCEAFQPATGCRPYGWTITLVDPSKISYSLGGVAWTDISAQYYQVVFSMPRLSPGDAFGPMLQIMHTAGVREDMVLCLMPDNADLNPFTTFYGRFKAQPKLANPSYEKHNASSITFMESI